MAIGSGNFGDALYPGIHHWYGYEYDMHEEQYSKFMDIESSTRAYEESMSASSFGVVPTKTKGGSVTYDTAKQNWKNTLTHVTYGLGFIIERELWEDDQYSMAVKRLPRELARSVRHTMEVLAANILNNAFTAANAGADGLELCSTAHLLGGGGTYQNEPTNGADLDSTSLEQALVDIGDFVNDRGLNIQAKAVKAVVPTELAWTAAKLFGSDLVPEDANNAINPGKGIMPYVVNNYLTDPDAWFIKTNVPYGLICYKRREPEFTQDNDFDTENAKYKATFRLINGWDDPRGVYGSPGS